MDIFRCWLSSKIKYAWYIYSFILNTFKYTCADTPVYAWYSCVCLILFYVWYSFMFVWYSFMFVWYSCVCWYSFKFDIPVFVWYSCVCWISNVDTLLYLIHLCVCLILSFFMFDTLALDSFLDRNQSAPFYYCISLLFKVRFYFVHCKVL